VNNGNGWLSTAEPGMGRTRMLTKTAGAIVRTDLTELRFFMHAFRAGNPPALYDIGSV
jgi:hypothetical protein